MDNAQNLALTANAAVYKGVITLQFSLSLQLHLYVAYADCKGSGESLQLESK